VSVPQLDLVPFTPGHYSTLSSWFEDQRQLTQWGGAAVRYPLDIPQLTEMLPAPPRRLSWMAVLSGAVVGHAQLSCADPTAGVMRLGRIGIAPASRGRRLAIPMLERVLDQAFAREEIERVDLGVYTWNANAIRIYRRIGFTPDGAGQASVHVGDEAWDLQEMSLYRETYLGPRASA
jgi:RimJ/RimL family protein N-acetyltransferase